MMNIRSSDCQAEHRAPAFLGPRILFARTREADLSIPETKPHGDSSAAVTDRGVETRLRSCVDRDCPGVARPTTLRRCPVCRSETATLPWDPAGTSEGMGIRPSTCENGVIWGAKDR
jgi:hypothetical protein